MSYHATGQTPSLLPNLAVETHQPSGLRAVSQSARPTVIAALQSQGSYTPGPTSGQDLTGAWKVSPSIGDKWVDRAVTDGYMVLVRTDQLAQGTMPVIMTQSPQTIANKATAKGGYVMLAGPGDLAVAAVKLRMHSCPGGQAWSPAQNKCVDIPGGVVDDDKPPATAKARSGWSAWGAPAAVIGVVLLLTAAVASRQEDRP